MLALVLACTGPIATPPAPYAVEVNFTVERGTLSPEEVDIGVGGVHLGPDFGLFTASAEDGLQELMFLTGPLSEPGEIEVLEVRYRKGQQFMSSAGADCSITLDALADEVTSAEFTCTGLVPTDDPDAEPSALSGTWFGGTLSELDNQPGWLPGDGYRARVEWEDVEGIRVTQVDDALLVPWRGDQWWTIIGTQDSRLDLVLKTTLDPDELRVEKSTNATLGSAFLRVESDSEISVASDSEELTGTDLEFLLWDDMGAAPDELNFRVF
ncbi:MAG: hypothetical protein ACI9VR_001308 [Cognaticolwellia sp.]|jgi:hypothetical protein